MPRLNYPLKKYIKAVEKLAKLKGFDRVDYFPTNGSVVRFELFLPHESEPTCFWVIHHSHEAKKNVWSIDDYRKAAARMNATEKDLFDILKNV